MNKLSLNTIDIKTHEGHLLFAAMVILTTELYRDKTPEQVIDRLYEVAANTDKANEKPPFTDVGNVYWQINQLANVITRKHPEQITEGGAVDVAIKILSRPNQSQAILGFITHLCHDVYGVTVGKGYNPANTMPELVRYCKANEFPDPHKYNSIAEIKFPNGM